MILAAELLDVGLVTTFIGRDCSESLADNWPRFLHTWKPIVAYAESRGVRIGIENCPMYFTADEWPGGRTWRTARRSGGECSTRSLANFGLNYDPSHLVWQQMDYVKPLREFAGRIFHVHAKDCAN